MSFLTFNDTGKTVFYLIHYKNLLKQLGSASDLLHMFAQLIKFYTFHCYIFEKGGSSYSQTMSGCFFQ